MILIVFGLPGSGKTYFSDLLAEKINAVHINSDRVRKKMAKMGQYDNRTKMKVYDEMLHEMKSVAKSGQHVIVDATFYKRAIREMFIKAAKELGAESMFIEIKASDPTTKERMSRPRRESEADYNVYLKLKDSFEPLETEHLTMYSDQMTIDDMLHKALNYIKPK